MSRNESRRWWTAGRLGRGSMGRSNVYEETDEGREESDERLEKQLRGLAWARVELGVRSRSSVDVLVAGVSVWTTFVGGASMSIGTLRSN